MDGHFAGSEHRGHRRWTRWKPWLPRVGVLGLAVVALANVVLAAFESDRPRGVATVFVTPLRELAQPLPRAWAFLFRPMPGAAGESDDAAAAPAEVDAEELADEGNDEVAEGTGGDEAEAVEVAPLSGEDDSVVAPSLAGFGHDASADLPMSAARDVSPEPARAAGVLAGTGPAGEPAASAPAIQQPEAPADAAPFSAAEAAAVPEAAPPGDAPLTASGDGGVSEPAPPAATAPVDQAADPVRPIDGPAPRGKPAIVVRPPADVAVPAEAEVAVAAAGVPEAADAHVATSSIAPSSDVADVGGAVESGDDLVEAAPASDGLPQSGQAEQRQEPARSGDRAARAAQAAGDGVKDEAEPTVAQTTRKAEAASDATERKVEAARDEADRKAETAKKAASKAKETATGTAKKATDKLTKR